MQQYGGFFVKGTQTGHKNGLFFKSKTQYDNPNKWFVYYNYPVPDDLKDFYLRRWKPFKVYMGINRLQINECER